ncbi:hypothetical protein ACTA71_005886 [Dictyostelium dimigraforme]
MKSKRMIHFHFDDNNFYSIIYNHILKLSHNQFSLQDSQQQKQPQGRTYVGTHATSTILLKNNPITIRKRIIYFHIQPHHHLQYHEWVYWQHLPPNKSKPQFSQPYSKAIS